MSRLTPPTRRNWQALPRRAAGCRRHRPASPTRRASFSAPAYHFDLARPGAALYGVAPDARQAEPDAAGGAAAGQGDPDAHGRRRRRRRLRLELGAPAASRIATVSVGYADGYLRSLSGRGAAWLGEVGTAAGRAGIDGHDHDRRQRDCPKARMSPGHAGRPAVAAARRRCWRPAPAPSATRSSPAWAAATSGVISPDPAFCRPEDTFPGNPFAGRGRSGGETAVAQRRGSAALVARGASLVLTVPNSRASRSRCSLQRRHRKTSPGRTG